MSPQGWLPITEYAGKYRVSISTLRRRIKAGDIEYSFQEGKYLLKDSPLATQSNTQVPAAVAPPQKANGGVGLVNDQPASTDGEDNSPILATANRLLNELKKAYSLILQEKEEQVLQIREEVADLRTLVRVLEAENERLRRGTMMSEPWTD